MGPYDGNVDGYWAGDSYVPPQAPSSPSRGEEGRADLLEMAQMDCLVNFTAGNDGEHDNIASEFGVDDHIPGQAGGQATHANTGTVAYSGNLTAAEAASSGIPNLTINPVPNPGTALDVIRTNRASSSLHPPPAMPPHVAQAWEAWDAVRSPAERQVYCITHGKMRGFDNVYQTSEGFRCRPGAACKPNASQLQQLGLATGTQLTVHPQFPPSHANTRPVDPTVLDLQRTWPPGKGVPGHARSLAQSDS